jgi:hypothetical protein
MCDDQRGDFERHLAAWAEQPNGFAAGKMQTHDSAGAHVREHASHSANVAIEAAGAASERAGGRDYHNTIGLAERS